MGTGKRYLKNKKNQRKHREATSKAIARGINRGGGGYSIQSDQRTPGGKKGRHRSAHVELKRNWEASKREVELHQKKKNMKKWR